MLEFTADCRRRAETLSKTFKDSAPLRLSGEQSSHNERKYSLIKRAPAASKCHFAGCNAGWQTIDKNLF